MHGIYIHIPFCLSKCPYCDFYSVGASSALMEDYKKALLRAIEYSPKLDCADTVYFGGGTPTAMPAEMLAEILEAVGRRFYISKGSEITTEANPGTVSRQYFETLQQAGFNRVSMGMQSANENELRQLGRRHNVPQVGEAVEWARAAGIDNISLDLMLGTPKQTAESAIKSAQHCAQLGVQHISAYILKTEKGTPFGDNPPKDIPDEDKQADIYLAVCEELERLGYSQYEISNFAKPGLESRHNLKYWRCEPYLGLGPSAHSFYDGRRRFFPRDLAGFINAGNPFEIICDDGEGGDLNEQLMLRLRLAEGANLETLAKSFPQFDTETVEKKSARFVKLGLAELNGKVLRLTRQGFLVSNSIIAEFLQ